MLALNVHVKNLIELNYCYGIMLLYENCFTNFHTTTHLGLLCHGVLDDTVLPHYIALVN